MGHPTCQPMLSCIGFQLFLELGSHTSSLSTNHLPTNVVSHRFLPLFRTCQPVVTHRFLPLFRIWHLMVLSLIGFRSFYTWLSMLICIRCQLIRAISALCYLVLVCKSFSVLTQFQHRQSVFLVKQLDHQYQYPSTLILNTDQVFSNVLKDLRTFQQYLFVCKTYHHDLYFELNCI